MRVPGPVFCVVMATARLAVPQVQPGATAAPMELDGTSHQPVPLTPREVIRAADDPEPGFLTAIQRAIQGRDQIYNGMVSVELSVVLNWNGRVESATAIRGPKRFYEQAVEIEMHRAFEPVRDGKGDLVRAHFTDAVSVDPPERWLEHAVGFPEPVDLSTFRIALRRTTCFGMCPSYVVSVAGNGDVVWEGDRFVAVPGAHRAKISQQAVQELVGQVRASQVLNALHAYTAGWTDGATYTLTLDVNGMHKKVVDYMGEIVGLPTSVRELEEAVDRSAGTEKWIKGNAELMPSLRAEHWNFAAETAANVRLYDAALERGDRALLAAFGSARGPVFSADPKFESPACVASGAADSEVALRMLATVPKGRAVPQHTLDACLVSAARGGNLEMVNVWLARGASLRPAPLPRSEGEYVPELEYPLTAAVQGGSPAVVRRLLQAHAPVDAAHDGGRNLVTAATERCCGVHPENKAAVLTILLEAGADPNEETERDRPALFAMNDDAEVVPLLVAHGARVNQRDSRGNTPLMSAVYMEVLRALLKAGADPALRNGQGKTAGEWFRATGLKEQADLLDAAARSKVGGNAE